MNKRREFLRNALMAVAVSLLPKILQPAIPEVIEEEMAEISIPIVYRVYEFGCMPREIKIDNHTLTIKVPKSKEQETIEYLQSIMS